MASKYDGLTDYEMIVVYPSRAVAVELQKRIKRLLEERDEGKERERRRKKRPPLPGKV